MRTCLASHGEISEFRNMILIGDEPSLESMRTGGVAGRRPWADWRTVDRCLLVESTKFQILTPYQAEK